MKKENFIKNLKITNDLAVIIWDYCSEKEEKVKNNFENWTYFGHFTTREQ